MLFALCSSVEAQQPTKIPRIGYLGGASTPARIEAFRKGLRELGYVEGKEHLHRVKRRNTDWRSRPN